MKFIRIAICFNASGGFQGRFIPPLVGGTSIVHITVCTHHHPYCEQQWPKVEHIPSPMLPPPHVAAREPGVVAKAIKVRSNPESLLIDFVIFNKNSIRKVWLIGFFIWNKSHHESSLNFIIWRSPLEWSHFQHTL